MTPFCVIWFRNSISQLENSEPHNIKKHNEKFFSPTVFGNTLLLKGIEIPM